MLKTVTSEAALRNPGSRGNRASRRAMRTRQRLLDAALALFSERGVERTAIDEITERADVGKGTFYRHFENKEAITIALVETAVDRLVASVRSHCADVGDLPTLIERLVQAHNRFFLENQEMFLLLFQGRVLLKLQRENLEDLERPYLTYLEETQAQVARFLPTGVDALRLRRFACALAGFVSGFFSFAMIGMAQEEMENSLGPVRKAFVRASSAFLGS